MKRKPRIWEPGTPLTERRLAAVERKLRISMPDSYRSFLLEHNGGRPEPAGFCYKHQRGPYTDGEVNRFLSIGGGRNDDLERHHRLMRREHRWLPTNLIPIAIGGLGEAICISVSGEDRGAIYYRDNEGLPGKPGAPLPEWDNIHLIADSFEEFVNGLCRRPGSKSRRKHRPGRTKRCKTGAPSSIRPG